MRKSTNIQDGDWVLHPDFPYEPLHVKELRDEEEDGTRILHVSHTLLTGAQVFSVFIHDCVKYHKREEVVEPLVEDGNEEEILRRQLSNLRNKKNQQEQDDFERETYDAFLRCRNSTYIMSKWKHGDGVDLRKISKVIIAGTFGKPVDGYYRGISHNFEVTCDVHESIRVFQKGDYTVEDETGYGGISKQGGVSIDIETFSKVAYHKVDFIQRDDYPVDEVQYNKVKIYALARVESLSLFYKANPKLQSEK